MSASDARAACLALAALALWACGHQDDAPAPREPDDATPQVTRAPEAPGWWGEGGAVDAAGLMVWTRARGYAGWASSGWPRATAEGGSRVFVDASLQGALGRGEPYPVGAVAVRELFEDDLFTPRATNVLVKVSPGMGADTWRWFELPAAGGAWTVDARAAQACAGCHASAADALLTDSPLPHGASVR
jgi:hypothetical protein